jgi:hypothetical protein
LTPNLKTKTGRGDGCDMRDYTARRDLARLRKEVKDNYECKPDDGPELLAKVLDWTAAVGVGTTYIELSSPWENGCCKVFYPPREAPIIIECWRRESGSRRPHSAVGYGPHAPQNQHPDGSETDHALSIDLAQ